MRVEELIARLTELAAEHPGLKVQFRQGNGYLAYIDEAYFEKDTFEQRIELA